MEGAADRRGGDIRDRLDLEDLEAEPLQQRQVSRPPPAEPEVGAGRDRLGPHRSQVSLGEHLGLERHQLGRERGDERRFRAGVRDQLEAALERRDQLDLVPERDARMWVEGDDRGRSPVSLAAWSTRR